MASIKHVYIANINLQIPVLQNPSRAQFVCAGKYKTCPSRMASVSKVQLKIYFYLRV